MLEKEGGQELMTIKATIQDETAETQIYTWKIFSSSDEVLGECLSQQKSSGESEKMEREVHARHVSQAG